MNHPRSCRRFAPALLLFVLLPLPARALSDVDVFTTARKKSEGAIKRLDFAEARQTLTAAESVMQMDALKKQVRRDLQLVSLAEQGIQQTVNAIRLKPLKASSVKLGDKGVYRDATANGVSQVIPPSRGQPGVTTQQTWRQMPGKRLARIASLTAKTSDPDAQVRVAALCIAIGQIEFAAMAVKNAMKLDASVEETFKAMGKRAAPVLERARVLLLKDRLDEISRMVRRGKKAEARQALVQFASDHAQDPAFKEVADRFNAVGRKLGGGAASGGSSGSMPIASSSGKSPSKKVEKFVYQDCPVCLGKKLIQEMGCPTCNREGYVNDVTRNFQCPTCKGARVVPANCYTCRGTGKYLGRKCPTCKGKGKFVCTYCKGKGRIKVPNPERARYNAVQCPTCGGSGWQDHLKCKSCAGAKKVKYTSAGRGVIYYNIFDCPFCGGTGETYPFCRTCKRTGTRGKKTNRYPCPTCAGTGNAHHRCQRCRGKGWIDQK